jgi:uncharacterized protein
MKMKVCAAVVLVAAALAVFAAWVPAAAQSFPQPTGLVNDFAGVIDEQSRARLDELLTAVEQKTTAQITVVTVQTFAPYADIDEYAVKLFAAWGVGKKGKDNGVLIVAAMKDRRMRIEVGYGLEGAIPDAAAGEIVSEVITPYFKQGQFGEGLYAGASAVSGRVLNEYGMSESDLGLSAGAEPGEPPLSSSRIPLSPLGNLFKNIIGFICVIFLIILFIRHPSLFLLLLLSGRGGGGGWSSGSSGGFGGGFGGFGGGMSGGGGASGGW